MEILWVVLAAAVGFGCGAFWLQRRFQRQKQQEMLDLQQQFQMQRQQLEAALSEKEQVLAQLQGKLTSQQSKLKQQLREKEKKISKLQQGLSAEQTARQTEQALVQLQEDFAELEQQTLLSRIGLAPYLDFASFDFVTVLQAIIQNLETYQQIFMDSRILTLSGEWFRFFEFNCLSSYFSFPTETITPYLQEYRLKFATQKDLSAIDSMEGHAFEHWCADLLQKVGFTILEVTKASGDQGGDIIAEKGGIRYAIQCKRYALKDKVGNKAVQQVHAGKDVYKCHISAVMTNTYFTASAKELANSTKTLLWDRDEIRRMLESVSAT